MHQHRCGADSTARTFAQDALVEHVAQILSVSDAEQLERIAQEVERLQTTAVLYIAAHAAKAHELFRYNRDEGGYAGWMKDRLGHSRSSAYRLLDVHRRFGGGKSFPSLGTLPVSAVYLLAAPATPQKAVDQVVARIEAGERMSCAAVADAIARARPPKIKEAVLPAGEVVVLRDWKTGEETVEVEPAEDIEHAEDQAGELGDQAMVTSSATALDVDPPKTNNKITAEPEAEPETIEAAEAEVKRLKGLKAEIKANGGGDEIGPEQAKALAEFKAACATLLPKLAGDALQQAIDHFAEAVEVPAGELMPDLSLLQIDLKIAKAEVAALKRKLAGKLPPRESRAAAWARLAGEAVSNVEELIAYTQEFEEAKEGQPDGLQDGPFAQKCDAICSIDLESALSALQEAEEAEVPLGFGRD